MNRKSLQQLPTRAIYVIYVCACSGPSAFLWPLGGSGCRYNRSQSLPLGRQIVGRGVRILDLELRGDPLGPLDHTLACFRGNLVFLIQFLQTISRIRDDSARRPGDFARETPWSPRRRLHPPQRVRREARPGECRQSPQPQRLLPLVGLCRAVLVPSLCCCCCSRRCRHLVRGRIRLPSPPIRHSRRSRCGRRKSPHAVVRSFVRGLLCCVVVWRQE